MCTWLAPFAFNDILSKVMAYEILGGPKDSNLLLFHDFMGAMRCWLSWQLVDKIILVKILELLPTYSTKSIQ
jgi:hypothetical protein